jgi:tRNA-dihydrouridine synthase B
MAIKTFQIHGVTIPNRYILAPMHHLTDYSMRKMAADKGAGMVYTEMLSCKDMLAQDATILSAVRDTRKDKATEPNTKLALQIYGADEATVLAALPLLEKEGDYDFLDFNIGCPRKEVMDEGAGCAWLTKQEALFHLLTKLVSLSKKPVLLKTRTGIDAEIDLPAFAKKVEACGVSLICIHGRTRSQFFQGPVDYDLIRKTKEALTIPVLANGGIRLANAEEVFKATSADGLMIGQASLGDPKIFEDLLRQEEGLPLKPNGLIRQGEDLRAHLSLLFASQDLASAIVFARRIFPEYVTAYVQTEDVKEILAHCETAEDFMKLACRLEYK